MEGGLWSGEGIKDSSIGNDVEESNLKVLNVIVTKLCLLLRLFIATVKLIYDDLFVDCPLSKRKH